ncbi:MAG TPA: hypothetical protein VNX27_04790 [Chthoniobacterales bacterium]|nr:hypothetical protein [Chthoniobacterales bacterium]
MNLSRDDQSRHLWLLIWLVVIFIASPFVAPYYYGPTILNVIGAAMLLSATYAVSRRRSFFIVGLAMSLFSIAMTVWLAAAPGHWLIIISHGSLMLLIGFFAVAILSYVLGSGKVTWDKIYGAICAYLLLGYAWTFAYSLVFEIEPESFMSLTSPMPHDIVGRVMQLRYFSFVTARDRWLWRHRAACAGSANPGSPRSNSGPVLSCRASGPPGRLAHRAWQRPARIAAATT